MGWARLRLRRRGWWRSVSRVAGVWRGGSEERRAGVIGGTGSKDRGHRRREGPYMRGRTHPCAPGRAFGGDVSGREGCPRSERRRGNARTGGRTCGRAGNALAPFSRPIRVRASAPPCHSLQLLPLRAPSLSPLALRPLSARGACNSENHAGARARMARWALPREVVH